MIVTREILRKWILENFLLYIFMLREFSGKWSKMHPFSVCVFYHNISTLSVLVHQHQQNPIFQCISNWIFSIFSPIFFANFSFAPFLSFHSVDTETQTLHNRSISRIHKKRRIPYILYDFPYVQFFFWRRSSSSKNIKIGVFGNIKK